MRLVRLVMMAMVLVFCGFLTDLVATTAVPPQREAVYPAVTKPEIVYVTDFALDAGEVHRDSGVLPQGGGPLQRGLLRKDGGILHGQSDPQSTASRLTDLLAASLVEELRNRSVSAVRLQSGAMVPRKGWVVRGEFVEVDEGNRVRRAVIGFGAGATNMDIEVQVADLATYPDEPFLLFGTRTGSGKMPGAAVTLNPYVAAAKFVMSKNASDKDVKHAASQIAGEIVNYMNANRLMPEN